MSYPVSISLTREASASRVQLIFGFLIALPDSIVLFFKSILASIYMFLACFTILFTGKYPQGWWEYSKGVAITSAQLQAYLMNLTTKKGSESLVKIDLAYPGSWSRLKLIFGAFFLIPHLFLGFFKAIGFMFVNGIAFLAILFTGSYPEGLWNYAYSFFRFMTRITFFSQLLLSDTPPTSGKAD